jgi:hypothetical protein
MGEEPVDPQQVMGVTAVLNAGEEEMEEDDSTPDIMESGDRISSNLKKEDAVVVTTGLYERNMGEVVVPSVS